VHISDFDHKVVRTIDNLFINTIIPSRLHERQQAERCVCVLKSCRENGKISFIIGTYNDYVNLRCCHASQVAELRGTRQKLNYFTSKNSKLLLTYFGTTRVFYFRF
jgi:hypothetical protein